MADVFVSYDRTDREHATRVAERLRGEGWTVWRDRELLSEWDGRQDAAAFQALARAIGARLRGAPPALPTAAPAYAPKRSTPEPGRVTRPATPQPSAVPDDAAVRMLREGLEDAERGATAPDDQEILARCWISATTSDGRVARGAGPDRRRARLPHRSRGAQRWHRGDRVAGDDGPRSAVRGHRRRSSLARRAVSHRPETDSPGDHARLGLALRSPRVAARIRRGTSPAVRPRARRAGGPGRGARATRAGRRLVRAPPRGDHGGRSGVAGGPGAARVRVPRVWR